MRDLYWSGGYNIRDLGGLPTTDGGQTARGGIVRSATLERLTDEGWAALAGYGIRTVIDLRNTDEGDAPAAARPARISRVPVPIDEMAGQEWYKSVWHLDGTPRIFARYLADHPQTAAALVKAVAAAEPGGVLIHCAGGRDRTGFSSALLLALADVEHEAIADDYVLSYERQRAAYAALGLTKYLDNIDLIDSVLAEAGVTAHEAMLAVLREFDLRELLSSAGVTEAELAAVRSRLRSNAAS
jgi:protein tyrosine/serine phosphatase